MTWISTLELTYKGKLLTRFLGYICNTIGIITIFLASSIYIYINRKVSKNLKIIDMVFINANLMLMSKTQSSTYMCCNSINEFLGVSRFKHTLQSLV
jgi:hypothetical protein